MSVVRLPFHKPTLQLVMMIITGVSVSFAISSLRISAMRSQNVTFTFELDAVKKVKIINYVHIF